MRAASASTRRTALQCPHRKRVPQIVQMRAAPRGRKWKDYRLDGAERYNRVMTLDPSEFIRRFLMHVLPSGFHRIRQSILKLLEIIAITKFNPRINPGLRGPFTAARSGRIERGS